MIRLLICFTLCSFPAALLAQDKAANLSGQKLVAVRVAVLESSADLNLKEGANLSAANLNELLAGLRNQNALRHYQFFNLASLEDRKAMVQVGQQEAVVTGRSFSASRGGGPPGRVSNLYQQQQTGSLVEVISRVRDDGQIIVELSVECSRLNTPKPADTESADASAEIVLPVTKTLTCQTTVLLAPGVSTIIAAGRKEEAEDSSREYIIVTATAK